MRVEGWLFREGTERDGGVAAVAATCPFAFFGAFVRKLGAVVEAEGAFARFAAEREEVEDVAIGHLAVRPDVFDIALHGRVAVGRILWRCGSHVGRDV